jgi:polyisoprenoid-binding protein YceI
MKTRMLNWTVNLAAAVVLTASLNAADDLLLYRARPGSQVTVAGTSTIHDWEVEGKIIGGYFKVEPAFATDKSLKSVKSLTSKETNPKAVISIPVRSLKSGKDSMDRIMQEAMKADKNPMIKFTLKEMVLKGDVPASGSPVTFATKGDLTVSGKTKPITMDITMERLPGDMLLFKGGTKVKMTDFGITPPSPKIPGLSMIKTGDEVEIKFAWKVKKR